MNLMRNLFLCITILWPSFLTANNFAQNLRNNICLQVMNDLAQNGIIWSPNGGVHLNQNFGQVRQAQRQVNQAQRQIRQQVNRVQRQVRRQRRQPARAPQAQNVAPRIAPQPQQRVQQHQNIISKPWLHAGKTPLSKLITYQQWTGILMHHVGRIPELIQYWQWAHQTGYSEVYYGGGTLRGLQHWLYNQLSQYHYNVVWNMPTPSIHNLQLQAGSDIDLWAPDNLIDKIKRELPMYANWDILGDTFHAGNVKLGGPTIEKIRINPWKFDDPLNGLAHYYEGRLVYHWTPEDEFRASFWVDKRGNTRTTEALRYVRFLYNLPELKVDHESKQNLQNIIANEADVLHRNDMTDYWIKKSVKKLLTATGYNMVETLDALREMKILQILGRYQYDFEFQGQLPDYSNALIARGFSLGELKWVQRMLPPKTVETCIQYMENIKNRVQTAEEFLILAKPHLPNPSELYLQQINVWVLNNLGKFLTLRPTQEQRQRLVAQMRRVPLTSEQEAWVERDLR